MNNLEKLVALMAKKDVGGFEEVLHDELSNRIADRINEKRDEIAASIGKESNTNE